MQLAVIFAILVAIAGVLFAMQNSTPVTVVFLLWRFDGSLAMIVLISIALGALAAGLVSTPSALKSHWAIKRQRKEIQALNERNTELHSRVAELQRQVPSAAPAEPPLARNPEGVVGLKTIAAQLGGSGRDDSEKAR